MDYVFVLDLKEFSVNEQFYLYTRIILIKKSYS